uniref:Uncharacterized protein n=1 Tax=Aegilops tauschii subsp. strangulata TaxID=200361 RepID=A0A453M8M4_AEGTS
SVQRMRGDMAQVLVIFSPEVLLSLLLCFLVVRRYYLARRSANNCEQLHDHGRRLPPSPPKLPLIGHLHLVGPDPHISLAELSRKHAGRDGLMLLRFGQVPNLVVSSPSAAEAVLRTHDHVFASRPPSIVADVLLSGPSDVALAPYGEYWRQARKLVTTHLLSARKVRALQGGREEEVRLVVAKLRAAAAARSAQDQDRDLVDILLSLQHEYNLTRDNVKVILMDMFAAGTDTSSIVLEFAMAELMRKSHLMAKLQAEVRMKETLRLHPPAPLLLPRLTMAECDDVNGYMVPAGTRTIVNTWALCRDTESWGEKAEEFWPERFMDGAKAAADFKGRDFQFLPFGAGRRICPGMGFGLVTVEIMLANLVYCFDWELPDGMREEDVDMADMFGVTMRRKEKLVLVPRIPQDANI